VLAAALAAVLPLSAHARETGWSVSLYSGPATNYYFTDFVAGKFHWQNAMVGVALDGRLAYLGWGWSLMGEAQLTQYTLGHNYQSAALGLGFEYNQFSWSRTLPTSFSVYMGPSYAINPPQQYPTSQRGSKKNLLNYLSAEFAVAVPGTTGWDVEFRTYHRSGAWGFYSLDADESTMIGLGIRRRF
jgi:hypothetical protein